MKPMDNSGETARTSAAAGTAERNGSDPQKAERSWEYADVLAAMRCSDPTQVFRMVSEIARLCRHIVESGEPVVYGFCWHVLAGLDIHQGNDSERGWSSNLFAFTRWMKAHPDSADRKAKDALKDVEVVIAEWPCGGDTPRGASVSRRAALRWIDWFGVEAEDARVEFLDVWDKVRVVPGKSLLNYALEQGDRHPISFNDDHIAIDTDGYKRFVSVAGWLQVTRGDGPIYLPCDLMAKKLNVEKMTVSRYRRFAMKDGFLAQTKEHRFNSKGDSEATEFRFDVSRVPMLRDAAQKGSAASFRLAKAESQRQSVP